MKLPAIVLMAVVVVVVIYIKLLPPNVARVSVYNKGKKRIENGEVNLCGERFVFTRLDPGQNVSHVLKVTRDCHYEVIATFASGETVSEEVGYVTHGLDFNDQLFITDDNVELATRMLQ